MIKSLNYILILFIILITIQSCRNVEKKDVLKTIKVGVFDKNGDSPWCITDAIEALKIDPIIDCEVICASQIVSDEINNFDAIVFPGGSGKSETQSLGEIGMDKVVKLVHEKGVAVIGICAGAYIMTETPNYASLSLNGFKAIDIEHDNRGHGLVKFSLNEKGLKIFPELKNRAYSFCQYYEGPVLVPAKSSEGVELSTMLSDVHTVKGSPANMTNNKPFIVVANLGKGKVASFVGHPECTPGMRWMLPRMVRWATNNELIKYSKSVVRPNFFNKEILCTKKVQNLQFKYQNMLSGTKEEKLLAMDKLVELASWSSKKLIPGMLRDRESTIRKKASFVLVELERTDAIPDLKSAIKNENNLNCKKIMMLNLNKLQEISNQ